MGANVVSGSGVGLVIKTGHDTYLGHISVTVEQDNVQTNFDNGLKKITRTLMTYMSVVVICVLLINGFLRNNWLQAFMTSFSKSSAMISRPLLAWTIFSRTGRMS